MNVSACRPPNDIGPNLDPVSSAFLQLSFTFPLSSHSINDGCTYEKSHSTFKMLDSVCENVLVRQDAMCTAARGFVTSNVASDAMAIAAHDLTYYHGENNAPSLSNISLQLPSGSRTVIVGANGGMCFAALSRGPATVSRDSRCT